MTSTEDLPESNTYMLQETTQHNALQQVQTQTESENIKDRDNYKVRKTGFLAHCRNSCLIVPTHLQFKPLLGEYYSYYSP